MEVSRANLIHNLRAVRSSIPKTAKVCAVVKADAYGHGAEFVARVAENEDLVQYFAVANMDEAERLRSADVHLPILIMSRVPTEELAELVKYELRPTIWSYQEAKRFQEGLRGSEQKLRVHLKIDTGMARLGLSARLIDLAATIKEVRAISKLPNIELEGVFSHFATAVGDSDYQRYQFNLFKNLLDLLAAEGINFQLRHIANSATILDHPEMSLDMVRAGIVLYGCHEGAGDIKLDLKPVMHYQSKISDIRYIAKGETVGYGRTWRAERPTRLAVMEAGYSDGLLRSLSNRGIVSIAGQRCPLVGKVCMDRSMIDITDLKGGKIGEAVHIFGGPEPDYIGADEQAALAGTISYELFCVVNRRVPRIYID
ncbi:MAG: alanine racemase [Eubacteriales bacterium]|nr:alanine racemase [Eubacteriales bacterium]